MPSVERDVPADPREPRTRGPLVPPGVGVRGPGERHRGPLREGRRGLRGVLGRPGPQPAGWSKEFTEVLDWSKAPFATWFADGELNVAYNCVDRHVEAGNGDKVAIHFVGEPTATPATSPTRELHEQVQKAANALLDLGVGKGDTVAIYLPMIPEAAVAMLACARIGAPHSVVFGGFSAEALYTRINDAKCKLVITSDGGYRRGPRRAQAGRRRGRWPRARRRSSTCSSSSGRVRTPSGTSAIAEYPVEEFLSQSNRTLE